MGSISAYDKMSYSQAKLPSLEEMMMAPAYMQQQHDLALEEGTKLMTEANLAANLAMEDPNSEAARNYQAYIGNIEQAVDLLNTKGLKGSNIKSAINTAKARYTRDIMPIIQAGAVREKDREIIQKAGLDPAMLIDIDPTQLSIDSYIKRGNQSYLPNMVSGSELEKATANSAKQLAEQIRTGGATLFTDTNLPFQYLAQIQKGASINEVQDAMIREGRNPEDVNTMTTMLRNIVDNTLKTYGIYDKFGNNKQLIDRAWGYAANGLYSAIGKPDTQIVTDQYGKQRALKGPVNTNLEESPELPQNPYNPVFINELDKKGTNVLKSMKHTMEHTYKLFLDPTKAIDKTPLDAKTARATGAKPAPELSQEEKMKLSSKYWKQIVGLAEAAGIDPYYMPDKNGSRQGKPLPVLLKEMDAQIENASGGIRGDEVIIDNDSKDSFISNILAGSKKIINEKGEDISNKFVISAGDNSSKLNLKEGTRMISLPQLGKIRIENAKGDVGYINLDQFGKIKNAQENFTRDYNNLLLGEINSDGSLRDYESNIEYLNSQLENQGNKYRIDISKFNLGTQSGQIKALRSIIKGKLQIDRDEYMERFKSLYTKLTDAQKRGMSENEFINRKFNELENEIFYNQTARASRLNTASYTNTAVESLLRTQTTTPQNVSKPAK